MKQSANIYNIAVYKMIHIMIVYNINYFYYSIYSNLIFLSQAILCMMSIKLLKKPKHHKVSHLAGHLQVMYTPGASLATISL